MEDVVRRNNELPTKSRVKLENNSGTSGLCVQFGGKQEVCEVHLVNYTEHVWQKLQAATESYTAPRKTLSNAPQVYLTMPLKNPKLQFLAMFSIPTS